MNKEREKLILEKLVRQKKVTVKEIAKELYVSEPSVRRDFISLEKQNLIKRIHGGAIIEETALSKNKIPFALREMEESTSKLVIAKKAVECGFGKVLLDNVCFPSDFLLAAPVYLSYEEGMTKNGALTQFISDVCAEVGKNNVIVCGDVTAFAEISALPDEKYGGELTGTECMSFCLDFRSGSQYSAQLENSEKLRYVEQMPLAFILDAATLAINELGNKTDAYFFCVMIDAEEENAEKYVNFAGTENIIYVISD